MRTTTKAVWALCAWCLGSSSTRLTAQVAPMPDEKLSGEAALQNAAVREKESRARLGRLAQAALQAAHQTDDKFRFSNRNYAAKIESLRPEGTPLFTGTGARPRFNDNLANISIHAIEDPQNVILFYEGTGRNLDFRYNGWAVVAMANGTSRSVTPSQAQTLRWHRSRVLDAQENDAKNGADLSSPEKTARVFIGALNAGRFDLARRCIAGVDAVGASSEALPGWDATRFALDLSRFEAKQLSATILVAQYQVKVGSTPFFNGGMTAFVFDKGWRIAPAPTTAAGASSAVSLRTNSVTAQEAPASVLSPLAANGSLTPNSSAPGATNRPAAKTAISSASRQAGTLSLLAAALLNPKAMPLDAVLDSTTESLQSIGASRLKSVGLGALQLAQDYDEKLDFGPGDFKEKLMPYMKNDEAFNSPLTGQPYAMNPALSGLSLAQIDAPAQTVLFYDGSNGGLNFSSDGTAAVLFMDGHVEYVSPEQAANLIWMPPPTPVAALEIAPPDLDELP